MTKITALMISHIATTKKEGKLHSTSGDAGGEE